MTVARVAYVVNVFPKISETFVLNEIAEVRRRGIDVLILSLRRPDEPFHHPLVNGDDLLDHVVYDAADFAARVYAFRPELVHAHFATRPTEAARTLALDIGVPFSFTAHSYDIYGRPPADFRARAESAGALITVSEANADYIASTFGVDRARIDVIPCGVDTTVFVPLSPQAPPTGIPLVVSVARLHPAKNLPLLLAALARLRDENVRFDAVIVGDGKARGEVEEALRVLALTDQVELAGLATQPEVRAWWQRASVAVLSSDREGFPVSLMEAAACGVPAVATAVGGVAELVDDGITGLLVPPGDVGALAAALRRLMADPALRRSMSLAARARAVGRFSLQHQVDRMLDRWDRMVLR